MREQLAARFAPCRWRQARHAPRACSCAGCRAAPARNVPRPRPWRAPHPNVLIRRAHPSPQSRFLVLLAVVGAVTMGAGMFVKGIITVRKAWVARSPANNRTAACVSQRLRLARPSFRQALLMGKGSDMGIKAVESLDEFLTGCASLVFGMVRLGPYALLCAPLRLPRAIGPV